MVHAHAGVASLVHLHDVHHVCPWLGGRLAVGSRLDGIVAAAHLQSLAPELGDLVDRVAAPFAATRLAAGAGHVARTPLAAARQLARIQARRATSTAPACRRCHWPLVMQHGGWRRGCRCRRAAAL